MLKSYHLAHFCLVYYCIEYTFEKKFKALGHASFIHLGNGPKSPNYKCGLPLQQVALASSLNKLDQIDVSVEKPMGIIIEEIDVENPKAGVRIASVNPGGNAARAMSSTRACVHDVVLAINGVSCLDKDFDQIMEEITTSSSERVTLTLGRDSKAIVISFPNGINVAARSGEYLGNVAQTAQYREISYKCRSGGCGTCEQNAEIDGKGPRLMRPCVATVPKDCKTIKFLKN
jgi:hypothetical protein